MLITVYVDPAAAVRAGKAESGALVVPLDQADMDGLTATQRETLARALSSEQRLWVAEPTVADLCQCLDRLEVQRVATAATTQRQAAEYLARCLARCEEVIAARETVGDPPCRRIYWPSSLALLDDPSVRPQLLARPDVVAWQAEIDAANLAAAHEREVASAREADARRREAAKLAEAERQYEVAAAEVARTHGTPSQRERQEAGVLRTQERDALVHDVVFAALEPFERYVRLVKRDALHEDEDCREEVSYVADDETDGLTAEQWTAKQALIAAAPAGATLTVRWHKVSCACSGRTGYRWSMRLAVDWHGRTLSREYACPPGVMPDGGLAV